jgi:hypothetical protein
MNTEEGKAPPPQGNPSARKSGTRSGRTATAPKPALASGPREGGAPAGAYALMAAHSVLLSPSAPPTELIPLSTARMQVSSTSLVFCALVERT